MSNELESLRKPWLALDRNVTIWQVGALVIALIGWYGADQVDKREDKLRIAAMESTIKNQGEILAGVSQQRYVLEENAKALKEVREALKDLQALQRFQSVTEFRLGNLECKTGIQCRNGGKS